MLDPIFLGPPVSETGKGGVDFPVLSVPLWYEGNAPVAKALEQGTVPATFLALPEEGGSATAAAVLDPVTSVTVTQARILFAGVWDVIFIDSFNVVPMPIPDCALVLQVFAEDGETVAWEVGTSPFHAYPYLCRPENYGAQELDIIAGAATIGQVEVIVIDKAQVPGDQDSGWVTERLTDGAVPAIRDRRCRLVRFIGEGEGFVVIADGPADTPRLDSTYAAYKWVIRDVRETERKIRAFTRTGSTWLLPMGVENGWGSWDDDGSPEWLISPREPLVGTFRVEFAGAQGNVVLDDYWQDAFTSPPWWPSTPVVLSREVELATGLLDLLVSQGELQGSPGKTLYTWPDLELLWRLEGSGDQWTVIQPSTANPILRSNPVARSLVVYANDQVNGGAELTDGTLITAAIKFMLQGATLESTHDPDTGALVWVPDEGDYPGNFPLDGQRVECAIRYIGVPTETVPLYIEFDDDGVTRLTAGRFLQKLYDGEYSGNTEAVEPEKAYLTLTGGSYRLNDTAPGDAFFQKHMDGRWRLNDDPVGAATIVKLGSRYFIAEDFVPAITFIPTGIRYTEADLLLMTNLVRARITEPIEDLRDWAEKHVYAPTGWAPSLDFNLAISPSSQAIPDSFDGLPVFDDDMTEPTPSWNAGETLINLLRFEYERWVAPILLIDQQAESIDQLEPRDVIYSFQSAGSVTRRENKEEYSGVMFAAVGDEQGLSVELEVGAVLAGDRKLYVFDRYNTGAQTIEIPVKRAVSKTLKPGQWIVVDLSWLPDYVLRRRGASWGGQIVAIHDIDCAWRIVLIEEAVPLVIS